MWQDPGNLRIYKARNKMHGPVTLCIHFNCHVHAWYLHQLSFNVSIVGDVTPEQKEVFTANLTLSPADRARLGTHVAVQPDLVAVTILGDDGTVAVLLNCKVLMPCAVRNTCMRAGLSSLTHCMCGTLAYSSLSSRSHANQTSFSIRTAQVHGRCAFRKLDSPAWVLGSVG